MITLETIVIEKTIKIKKITTPRPRPTHNHPFLSLFYYYYYLILHPKF
jgi:hypothetical protein